MPHEQNNILEWLIPDLSKTFLKTPVPNHGFWFLTKVMKNVISDEFDYEKKLS